MPDLLLEILSEEIPARMQPRARADLTSMILDGLAAAGIAHGAAQVWSTPRRLTLHVAGLPERTPDLREERKGPRVGAPEKALEGFLRATGLTREQLEKRADKKGESWFAVIEKPGRPVADLVAELVPETIRAFPWPKSMRWGESLLRWVRPISSILCLLDDRTVPFAVEGIASGNLTRGHRRAGGAFAVSGLEAYVAGLRARQVILDPAEREALVLEKARALCAGVGATLIEDPALLREVAGLTEWPVPLIGEIEEDFRALPPEVLQTSMREHQKYFSARDASGRVTHFIAVANTEAPDGGATILQGNSRVLRARLADAKFFWENDLRTVHEEGLTGMAAPLAQVSFHAKLGSQGDRIARIAALAEEIAPKVGARPEEARLAAEICKADLESAMVGEFPELQGVMGKYYAREQGLPERIAAACADHYKPLGPSDAVPSEPVSIAVALADKIDMLTGFWAIPEKPTGSKDPFALRRAALGLIRLLLENQVRAFHLRDLTKEHLDAHITRVHIDPIDDEQRRWDAESARNLGVPLEDYYYLRSELNKLTPKIPMDLSWFNAEEFEKNYVDPVDDLLAFIADRLKVSLREQGVRHDLIDAVFALGGQDDLVLLVKRVEALQAFLATADGENLLQGYRRAANILAAGEKTGAPLAEGGEDSAPETVALMDALATARPEIDAALAREDFEAAMRALAGLRAPIDAFFEGVQVMAEDPGTRAVRLGLLAQIRDAMRRVADFSKVEG